MFEHFNRPGGAPVLLLCDHASAGIPAEYDNLGLDSTMLHRHIAWDVGAADLTRHLAQMLDAPALLSCYSRLLVDPNRALADPTLFMTVSDGVAIPANQNLDTAEKDRRLKRFYHPYHAAIKEALASFAARDVVPVILCVHSFTPIMDDQMRPWQIGVLWNRDPRVALPLIEQLRGDPDLCVGDNEPYSGRIAGYCMDAHGGDNGFPNVAIELRQDLIDTDHDARSWAEILVAALKPVLDNQALYQRCEY